MARRTLVRGLALATLAALSIPAAGGEAKPASQRREVADLLRAAREAAAASAVEVSPAGTSLLDQDASIAALPAPVWLAAVAAAMIAALLALPRRAR